MSMSIDHQDIVVSLAPYRDLPDALAQSIVDLAAKDLGSGYLDRRTLGTGNRIMAYAIQGSGSLAGFAIGRFVTTKEFVREHPTVEKAIQRLGGIGGLAETVVVAPESRRRGFGARLMRAVYTQILVASSGAPLLLPAWRHHDGAVPADGLARRLGFVPYAIVPDYWFADSWARGYSCPSCGSPCRCAAHLYVLFPHEDTTGAHSLRL